jgi:hypothetical protein
LACFPYYSSPDVNDLRILKRLADLGVVDAQHPTQKLSHKVVHYNKGSAGEFCRTCAHSDHGTPPHCELVQDPIEPQMWCIFWEKMS